MTCGKLSNQAPFVQVDLIISYHIPYHIISIISYHINHIISYHIISYHIISYHIISYHIISYHIISYHIKNLFQWAKEIKIAKLLPIKVFWLKKLKYITGVKEKSIHIIFGTQSVEYIFCSLQLKFSLFQHLIWLLKIESVLACFIIFGKVDQSLFLRKDIVSIPYVVICTFGSCESLLCLKL